MNHAVPDAPTVVVLMGVSGVGKTTVGRALADRLGWAFADADDLHSAANITRMQRGEGLTDADRAPWLAAVRALLRAEDETLRALFAAFGRLEARQQRWFLDSASPSYQVGGAMLAMWSSMPAQHKAGMVAAVLAKDPRDHAGRGAINRTGSS